MICTYPVNLPSSSTRTFKGFKSPCRIAKQPKLSSPHEQAMEGRSESTFARRSRKWSGSPQPEFSIERRIPKSTSCKSQLRYVVVVVEIDIDNDNNDDADNGNKADKHLHNRYKTSASPSKILSRLEHGKRHTSQTPNPIAFPPRYSSTEYFSAEKITFGIWCSVGSICLMCRIMAILRAANDADADADAADSFLAMRRLHWMLWGKVST